MHKDEINLKGILIFLAIVVASVLIMYTAVAALRRSFERRAAAQDREALIVNQDPHRPYFPFPREQPDPQIDREAVRHRESSNLTTYGWIDHTNGIVRIPIERAIDLLTQNPERRP